MAALCDDVPPMPGRLSENVFAAGFFKAVLFTVRGYLATGYFTLAERRADIAKGRGNVDVRSLTRESTRHSENRPDSTKTA